jgi:hypothetical protein
MSPTNSPRKLADLRARVAARLSVSEALNLVGIMLKSYPATNQADTREYVVALAGALVLHPREIAAACVHPVAGVVRECMFKPTIADIARWCGREETPLFAAYNAAEAEARTANALANAPRIVDRSGRPDIDELRAKHGPTWGLKTIVEVERDEARAADDRRQREMRDRQVLAEYAALGLDPVYASDGALASPSLLRSINRMPAKRNTNAFEGEDVR